MDTGQVGNPKSPSVAFFPFCGLRFRIKLPKINNIKQGALCVPRLVRISELDWDFGVYHRNSNIRLRSPNEFLFGLFSAPVARSMEGGEGMYVCLHA